MRGVQTPIHFDLEEKSDIGKLFSTVRSERELEQQVREFSLLFSKDGVFNLVQAGLRAAESLTLFRLRGKQVFAINRDFQTALATSSVDKVPFSLLRMPYKTVYVALENCEYLTGTPDNPQQLRGFYVHESSKVDSAGLSSLCWYFMGWGKNSVRSEDDDVFWFDVEVDSDIGQRADGDIDRINFDSIIQRLIKKFTGVMPAGSFLLETVPFCVKVFVNLILYLHTKGALAEKVMSDRDALLLEARNRKPGSKKFKELDRLISKASTVNCTKIAPRFVITASRSANKGDEKSITIRPHLRAGHFRGVWKGTRRSESGERRKGEYYELTWIEPVFVNGHLAVNPLQRAYYRVE